MNAITILTNLPAHGPQPGEAIPVLEERVAAKYIMPLLAGLEHLLLKMPVGSTAPDALPGFAVNPDAPGHLRISITWEGL